MTMSGSIAGLCVFLSLISMQSFKAVDGTRCYDAAAEENLTYARMCSDDRVTSHRVILDTYEAETTGKTTCVCQVYRKGDPVSLQFLNIEGFGNGSSPNTSQCGSNVRLVSKSNEHVINCSSFPSITTYVAPMDIIWTVLSAWDSKYCLAIKTTIPPDALITVSCLAQHTTTPATPQCVSSPKEDGGRDDVVPTAPTDMQDQCISVQNFVLAIVFGYLLAAAITVSTVTYFRRKNIQLENKLRSNAEDCHGTVSTVCTDLTSIASGTAEYSLEPEATINIYHEIDSNAIRDSGFYLEPVNFKI